MESLWFVGHTPAAGTATQPPPPAAAKSRTVWLGLQGHKPKAPGFSLSGDLTAKLLQKSLRTRETGGSVFSKSCLFHTVKGNGTSARGWKRLC